MRKHINKNTKKKINKAKKPKIAKKALWGTEEILREYMSNDLVNLIDVVRGDVPMLVWMSHAIVELAVRKLVDSRYNYEYINTKTLGAAQKVLDEQTDTDINLFAADRYYYTPNKKDNLSNRVGEEYHDPYITIEF